MKRQGSEASSLLPKPASLTAAKSTHNRHYRKGCLTSKPASLILFWNFSILLSYNLLFNIKNFLISTNSTTYQDFIPIIFAVVAIVLFISPLAGLLADIKFGRYKTISCSSFIITSMLCCIPIYSIGFIIGNEIHTLPKLFTGRYLILAVFGLAHITTILISNTIFITNAIGFGMDQLHDSPTQDSFLYIHWYVWSDYVSISISEVTWTLLFYDSHSYYIDSIRIAGLTAMGLSFCTVLLVLIISMCVIRKTKRWFLIEHGGVNPYKLVYRVIRFAWKHKIPVQRSAFTYCEDELPSRLDLGKQKYGGPHTIEEVEDVKAFLGILKVLIATGPIFMLKVASEAMLPIFTTHGNIFFHKSTSHHTYGDLVHTGGPLRYIFITSGLLSPLLVVLCIPLHLFVIRPFVLPHVPGMLKTIMMRIGLGLLLVILSLLCTLAMDVIVHKETDYQCMFIVNSSTLNYYYINTTTHSYLYQNVYFLTAEHALSALCNMLIDIAVLEFICSQSPYSMKGLLIGIFFSTRILFQALTLVVTIPFAKFWESQRYSLTCGTSFYLTNVGIGVVTFVVFAWVAKNYKYRARDESPNIHKFAEDYYSKTYRSLQVNV